jgi:hypothetical protein
VISRGQMVPIFEQTSYALSQKNQVSGVIKSDYGYHIVQLADLKPAQITSFEQVKNTLKEQLIQELTATSDGKKFASQVEEFQTSLEDQGDINYTAKKLNLSVQKFAKLTENNANSNVNANINPILTNVKVLNVIFSKEGQQKQASQAIEIASGQWVSVQVERFYPAQQPALATVRDAVLKQWQQEKANSLAQTQALAWYKKYESQPQKSVAELVTVPANWVNLLNAPQMQALGLSKKDMVALMSKKIPSLYMEEINPANKQIGKSSYSVYYVDTQRKATFDETQKQKLQMELTPINKNMENSYGYLPVSYMKQKLKVKVNF